MQTARSTRVSPGRSFRAWPMAGVSPRTMARWQSMKIAVPPSSNTVTTAMT